MVARTLQVKAKKKAMTSLLSIKSITDSFLVKVLLMDCYLSLEVGNINKVVLRCSFWQSFKKTGLKSCSWRFRRLRTYPADFTRNCHLKGTRLPMGPTIAIFYKNKPYYTVNGGAVPMCSYPQPCSWAPE
jgi:hypothetical protein